MLPLDKLAHAVSGNDKPYLWHCQDCGKATKHGKPYCVDHITKLPYASEVMRVMAWKEWEDERAREYYLIRGGRRPDTRSPTAEEILQYLDDVGASSVGDLNRNLFNNVQANYPILLGYLQALEEEGIIRSWTKMPKKTRYVELDIGIRKKPKKVRKAKKQQVVAA